eukprot:tig00000157_g9730.t1
MNRDPRWDGGEQEDDVDEDEDESGEDEEEEGGEGGGAGRAPWPDSDNRLCGGRLFQGVTKLAGRRQSERCLYRVACKYGQAAVQTSREPAFAFASKRAAARFHDRALLVLRGPAWAAQPPVRKGIAPRINFQAEIEGYMREPLLQREALMASGVPCFLNGLNGAGERDTAALNAAIKAAMQYVYERTRGEGGVPPPFPTEEEVKAARAAAAGAGAEGGHGAVEEAAGSSSSSGEEEEEEGEGGEEGGEEEVPPPCSRLTLQRAGVGQGSGRYHALFYVGALNLSTSLSRACGFATKTRAADFRGRVLLVLLGQVGALLAGVPPHFVTAYVNEDRPFRFWAGLPEAAAGPPPLRCHLNFDFAALAARAGDPGAKAEARGALEDAARYVVRKSGGRFRYPFERADAAPGGNVYSFESGSGSRWTFELMRIRPPHHAGGDWSSREAAQRARDRLALALYGETNGRRFMRHPASDYTGEAWYEELTGLPEEQAVGFRHSALAGLAPTSKLRGNPDTLLALLFVTYAKLLVRHNEPAGGGEPLFWPRGARAAEVICDMETYVGGYLEPSAPREQTRALAAVIREATERAEAAAATAPGTPGPSTTSRADTPGAAAAGPPAGPSGRGVSLPVGSGSDGARKRRRIDLDEEEPPELAAAARAPPPPPPQRAPRLPAKAARSCGVLLGLFLEPSGASLLREAAAAPLTAARSCRRAPWPRSAHAGRPERDGSGTPLGSSAAPPPGSSAAAGAAPSPSPSPALRGRRRVRVRRAPWVGGAQEAGAGPAAGSPCREPSGAAGRGRPRPGPRLRPAEVEVWSARTLDGVSDVAEVEQGATYYVLAEEDRLAAPAACPDVPEASRRVQESPRPRSAAARPARRPLTGRGGVGAQLRRRPQAPEFRGVDGEGASLRSRRGFDLSGGPDAVLARASEHFGCEIVALWTIELDSVGPGGLAHGGAYYAVTQQELLGVV